MENISRVAFLGLLFGIFGTTLGGVCGAFINFKSNKFISFILELAAGLMTAVICFDLIPNSFEFINITVLIIGIILGVSSMIYCNNFVNNKFNKEKNYKNDLLKVGMIIGIGLAIHNFPEGLAIGSGFEASPELGIALAIAICIHDFPEGIFQSRYQVENA